MYRYGLPAAICWCKRQCHRAEALKRVNRCYQALHPFRYIHDSLLLTGARLTECITVFLSRLYDWWKCMPHGERRKHAIHGGGRVCETGCLVIGHKVWEPGRNLSKVFVLEATVQNPSTRRLSGACRSDAKEGKDSNLLRGPQSRALC